MTSVVRQPMLGRAFQLVLLALAIWSVAYARFALGPLQESMRVDLMLTDNQMAWLQGPALAIPLAVSAIPIGLLIDRYARVPLFLFFGLTSLGASVMTALAPNLVILFVARCLLGVSAAAIVVGSYSMVADLYAEAQRGRATMVVGLGEVSGAPAAFALGGTLLAIAGAEPSSWRWALLVMSGLLVPVLLVMVALREPHRSGVVKEEPSVSQVWAELWCYRAVVTPLLLARIMVWIADGAVLTWAAPNFSRSFVLNPERVGAIMASALMVSGVAGPVLGGFLADLSQRAGGPRYTMTTLAVLALLSVPAALFAIAPSVTLSSVCLAGFLTLGFTIGTAAITVGTIVIPGELRGVYFALTLTSAALFSFGIAPLVISSLSGLLGGEGAIGKAMAIVCGTTSVLGSVVFFFGRQHFPSRCTAMLCATRVNI